MSWFKDDFKRKQEEKQQNDKHNEEMLRSKFWSLDPMVRRLLDDVGTTVWGKFIGIRNYKLTSDVHPSGGGWTVGINERENYDPDRPAYFRFWGYSVGLGLASSAQGTSDHFVVSGPQGKRAFTLDTSESELKKALKEVTQV